METITLNKPIKRGEKEIGEIDLREPSAGELRGVSLGELSQLNTDAVLKLLPRLTLPAITENEADDMPVSDLMKFASAIYDMLQGKPGNVITQKA